jgi:catechol 2,3-dioxygenase-like lactoylglutathione lyase family enzyme
MADRVKGIGHVAVVTRDLERLCSFFADVFGATLGERSERDQELGLGFIGLGGGTTLHVFERPHGPLGAIPDARALQAFTRGRIDHFSVEATDLAGFLEARDQLVARGASDGTVTDFGSLVSVFFTDPDGFMLELSVAKTEVWEPPFETQRPRRG